MNSAEKGIHFPVALQTAGWPKCGPTRWGSFVRDTIVAADPPVRGCLAIACSEAFALGVAACATSVGTVPSLRTVGPDQIPTMDDAYEYVARALPSRPVVLGRDG